MTDELVVRYVHKALTQQLAGETVDVAQLCRDHPHLASAVAESIQIRAVLPNAATPERLLGQSLDDRYELRAVRGAGAMGVVYAANDRSLDRTVAVKMLHPGVIATDVRQARFRREAKALASIQHDNIVSVFDHGCTGDGVHYIVMEYVDGASLHAILERAVEAIRLGASQPDAERIRVAWKLPESGLGYLAMVVTWIADLADALVTSHEAGVFHRDLKPSNVLVTREGRPVLLDFGIAVRLDDETLTAGGTAVGTPWYMAPEQVTATETATPTVDVYGLCATLYHLVTFRPPHIGDFLEVLRSLQHDDPPPPHKLRRDIPRDLCAILEKGLARDPRHRYADMLELGSDLRAFLDFRPTLARPLHPLTRFVRRARRRPAGYVTAALVVVALFVGMFLAWQTINSRRVDELRFQHFERTLPALICCEADPKDPLVTEIPEHRSAAGLLDEMLALKPHHLPTRILRATLHLDAGRRDESLADLARVAELAPSPFVDAVLDAYRRSPNTSRAMASIDLASLPEPESKVDCFLGGFLHFRAREPIVAHEHLSKAGDYLPARDLSLVVSLVLANMERRDKKRRRGLFQDLREAADQLQGAYGYPTARTAHVIGAAYVGLEDYVAARPHLERSLEIRPERHAPLTNLGLVHRRLGRYSDSIEVLGQAADLRPWDWNTKYNLAQTYLSMLEFDKARDIAGQLRPPESLAYLDAHLRARIAEEEAVQCRFRGDRSGLERAAAAAEAAYEEARQRGAPARRCDPGIAHVRTLLRNDLVAALGHYLRTMSRDPTNVHQLRNFSLALELDGSGPLARDLRTFLQRLAEALRPGVPAHDKQLDKKK